MGLPTDSTHLSQFASADMIEQYAGGVESQFAKTSIMRNFVPVRTVRGTDTIIERRVGKTTLKRVTDGVRPDATPTQFGKASLTVDTLVLARDNRSLLNELQTDFMARAELAKDHGKECGKLFDQSFIIQTIKGSLMSAPANLNGAFGAGKHESLSAGGDEADPDKLAAGIRGIITDFREAEIDTEELICFVRPTEYDVLLDNDKLVSRDYSDANGDFAGREVRRIGGVRIFETTRIPTTAITGHLLSNADNSNAYDVSAGEAKAVAVLMHPKSLRAGESIPLTSDIYYSKEERQWFIDSYLSFGVSVKRPDCCGCLFKA